MKSPLDLFMNLGNKITKGDPMKLMDYNFYMLWVLFVAFLGIFIGNIRLFFQHYQLQYLGWSIFGLAIMWFQYFNLSQTYQQRKILKESIGEKAKPIELESIEEMKDGFQ